MTEVSGKRHLVDAQNRQIFGKLSSLVHHYTALKVDSFAANQLGGDVNNTSMNSIFCCLIGYVRDQGKPIQCCSGQSLTDCGGIWIPERIGSH